MDPSLFLRLLSCPERLHLGKMAARRVGYLPVYGLEWRALDHVLSFFIYFLFFLLCMSSVFFFYPLHGIFDLKGQVDASKILDCDGSEFSILNNVDFD